MASKPKAALGDDPFASAPNAGETTPSVVEEPSSASDVVVLPERLGISECSEFQEQLGDYLDVASAFECDASKIVYCDAVGAQLVLCAIRRAKEQGKQTSWTGVSEYFSETAKQLGMVQELGLPNG